MGGTFELGDVYQMDLSCTNTRSLLGMSGSLIQLEPLGRGGLRKKWNLLKFDPILCIYVSFEWFVSQLVYDRFYFGANVFCETEMLVPKGRDGGWKRRNAEKKKRKACLIKCESRLAAVFGMGRLIMINDH